VGASDASGAEAGQDPIVFGVLCSGPLSGTTSVNLSWSGTATFGTDYTVSAAGATLSANGLTLTLGAGACSATLTVTPIDDTLAESSETVTLTLQPGPGYAVGSPGSATGTIADND
jgi:hypothetical protein